MNWTLFALFAGIYIVSTALGQSETSTAAALPGDGVSTTTPQAAPPDDASNTTSSTTTLPSTTTSTTASTSTTTQSSTSTSTTTSSTPPATTTTSASTTTSPMPLPTSTTTTTSTTTASTTTPTTTSTTTKSTTTSTTTTPAQTTPVGFQFKQRNQPNTSMVITVAIITVCLMWGMVIGLFVGVAFVLRYLKRKEMRMKTEIKSRTGDGAFYEGLQAQSTQFLVGSMSQQSFMTSPSDVHLNAQGGPGSPNVYFNRGYEVDNSSAAVLSTPSPVNYAQEGHRPIEIGAGRKRVGIGGAEQSKI